MKKAIVVGLMLLSGVAFAKDVDEKSIETKIEALTKERASIVQQLNQAQKNMDQAQLRIVQINGIIAELDELIHPKPAEKESKKEDSK